MLNTLIVITVLLIVAVGAYTWRKQSIMRNLSKTTTYKDQEPLVKSAPSLKAVENSVSNKDESGWLVLSGVTTPKQILSTRVAAVRAKSERMLTCTKPSNAVIVNNGLLKYSKTTDKINGAATLPSYLAVYAILKSRKGTVKFDTPLDRTKFEAVLGHMTDKSDMDDMVRKLHKTKICLVFENAPASLFRG